MHAEKLVPQTSHLRLYAPPDEAPPAPQAPGLPLAEFYRQTLASRLEREGRSADTLAEHARALRRWEQYWGAISTTGQTRNHRTTCPVVPSVGPPVDQITPKMLADFRDWLSDNPVPDARGMMRLTGRRAINKDLSYLSMMLGRGAETGDTMGAVRVRRVETPKPSGPIEMPDAHVDAIMDACRVATWPQRDRDGKPFGVPAPLVWRFAVVWYVNYGPRTEDLMAYTSDALPICWGAISDAVENPHHNGIASCATGWFFYIPYKTRRVKPQPLTLPINATARAWLNKLASASPDRSPRRPLLYLPRSGKTFYAQWNAILAAAGVAPKPLLQVQPDGTPELVAREYLLKNMRSTAATRIENHAPGVGKLVTGHAPDRSPDAAVACKVFEESYYNAESAIVAGLTTIPQPESFRRLLAS